jgi:hypothetical protein
VLRREQPWMLDNKDVGAGWRQTTVKPLWKSDQPTLLLTGISVSLTGFEPETPSLGVRC